MPGAPSVQLPPSPDSSIAFAVRSSACWLLARRAVTPMPDVSCAVSFRLNCS